jgi:transcriptional regulator with XRE-family HTH domain
MTVTSQNTEPQPLTPEKLAEMVKFLRELRKWSQETLADLSGLHIRTVQRIEGAESSSADSRRALARGFELHDIDAFNKPYRVYTDAEVGAERKKVEDKYLELEATTISSGRQLGEIAAQSTMDCVTQEIELTDEAGTELAYLVDYVRDYRDCASEYSEVGKLKIYAELQEHIDVLARSGISLCYAMRKTVLVKESWPDKAPWPVTVAYFAPFKIGEEKSLFIVEKHLDLPF